MIKCRNKEKKDIIICWLGLEIWVNKCLIHMMVNKDNQWEDSFDLFWKINCNIYMIFDCQVIRKHLLLDKYY